MTVASLCVLFGALILFAPPASSSNAGLVLVHDSTRHLDNGQFAFYKVPSSATPSNLALRVEVESLSGDADVYLAPHDEFSRPTFDNYALMSATYGLEVLEIPPSFARPLAIGIFAHGPAKAAEFRLKVFIDYVKSVDDYERLRTASHSDGKTYEEFVQEGLPDRFRSDAAAGDEAEAPGGGAAAGRGQASGATKNPRTPPRVEEKSSWVLTLLFHILEFLVEVLV